MNRCLMTTLLAVFTLSLAAQDNPLSSEAQQAWTRTKNYILAAAEKTPAENYCFKPAPESQSFGDLVAHTANSAMRACSGFNGEGKQAGADPASSKADLITVLGPAMAECSKAYGSLTAVKAAEMIAARCGSHSRLGTLYRNTIHIEHEYSQMAVHRRLNQ